MESSNRRVEYAYWVTKHVRAARAGALRRDDARNLLRRTVELYASAHRVRFLAWSFLPSRVDLVIADPVPEPLERIVVGLFGYFTRRFNFRYRKGGPLFRARFLWRKLQGTEAIREAMATVVGYPSLRGLRQARPGEEWSGLMTLPPQPEPEPEPLELPGPLLLLEQALQQVEVTDHGS